jgi:hypothetical protein
VIVNSTCTPDAHLQRDGRRGVVERHVDHQGVEHLHVYRADAKADYAAMMAARVPVVEAALAESEFVEAIATDGWAPLEHQTGAQFANRLRARYKAASQLECAKLAKWIMDRIDGGAFTEAAMRASFGLTAGQWTLLKSKLTTMRKDYDAVLAATGE